mgnify:CR=1 FL=1
MKLETLDFVIEIENGEWIVKVPREFPISQERFQKEIQSLKNLKSRGFAYIPEFKVEDKKLKIRFLPKAFDFSDRSRVFQILKELYANTREGEIGMNEIKREIEAYINKENPLAEAIYEKLKSEKDNKKIRIHNSDIIHGNLIFDHFRKDDYGNIYLIDFSFSGPGIVEQDIARFEVDELWNPKRRGTDYKSMREYFKKLEEYLESENLINKESLKYFLSLESIKRANFVKYYSEDPSIQDLLSEYFLLNGLEALESNNLKYHLNFVTGKKILLVTWGSIGKGGGVNTYIETFTHYLSKLGYKFYEVGIYEDPINVGNIVYEIKEGSDFKKVDKEGLENFIKKINPDIIHVNNYVAGLKLNGSSLLYFLKTLGKPIITTFHGCIKEILNDKDSPYIKGEEEAIELSDIIVGNAYLKEAFLRNYSEKRETIKKKWKTIEPASILYKYYNQVSDSDIKAIRKRYWGKWIIVYHGRITKDKGIIELIDAVRSLNEFGYPAQLILIGRLPQNVKSLIEIYGKELPSCVEYLGPMYGKELATYLKSAHISAQPSHYDSFNYSLLESLIFEVPAVSFDIFAPEYYYSKYITRAVYSTNYDERVNNLRRALIDVIENYEKRKSSAKKAKNELLPIHSVGNFVFSYSNLYENLNL